MKVPETVAHACEEHNDVWQGRGEWAGPSRYCRIENQRGEPCRPDALISRRATVEWLRAEAEAAYKEGWPAVTMHGSTANFVLRRAADALEAGEEAEK